LKRATTTTKTKVAKVRAKPKADLNASATLPWRCQWLDKHSIVFETCHAWWTYSHFL